MLDTNTLLSIAFSIIANFTNIVEVPPWGVPTKPGDLQRCIIGRPGSGPGSAVHLILTHYKGTEFWIRDGAIYAYSSPGSFFTLQNPSLVPTFAGTTTLTSNDVVRIAEKALRRLVKNGDPLGGGPPRVQQGSEFQGRRIPFFRVTWFKALGGGRAAEVEIDGRTGRIVCLDLWAEGFFDRAFQEEIKKRVHAPESRVPKEQPRWASFPKPTPDDFRRAVEGWLAFCQLLGLEPGAQTNLDDVDWSSSWLSPTSSRGVWSNDVCVVQACHLRFKSGACFDSAGGVASSHYCADAARYSGNDYRQGGQWGPFEGRPTKRWEDLAKALEARISERLGAPKSFFERMRARLGSLPEDPPGHPLKRAIVGWRLPLPKPAAPFVSPEERHIARLASGKTGFKDDGAPRLSPGEREAAEYFWGRERSLAPQAAEEAILNQEPDLLLAEFDLQTGEVKGLEFCFPSMFWPGLYHVGTAK